MQVAWKFYGSAQRAEKQKPTNPARCVGHAVLFIVYVVVHTQIYIYIYICVCALVVSGVLWVALTAWTSRFLLAGWQCPPSQGSRSLDPCESWLNCQRNIQKSGGFSHPCFYVCMCVCVSVSVIVCVCFSFIVYEMVTNI